MHRLLLALSCCGLLHGQITQIDLKLQSRDVDFSSAATTKPFKSGTSLPAACSVGEMFYKQDAVAGANLYACTSANLWTVQSGAGGGATMASLLGDFAVTRAGATTLAIGGSCSVSTPCSVRFGSLVYSFGASAAVTISAGTGLAFVYVSSAGVLTVGHNVTASCNAGCTAQAGVTAFPPDAIPLFTWSATNGAWDATGGADQRAFLSSKSVVAGAGLIGVETSGKTQLSADPTVIGLRTAAPATSSSSCTTGSWATDSSYFYLCVAANTWRRAALAAF